jgi:putative methionine-R-sulfoxide reductase with GAF domain
MNNWFSQFLAKKPVRVSIATWRDLGLARKLLVAFGALFVLGLAIAVSGLFGLSRVESAYEDTLAGGVEIRFRSNQLNSTLLEARRREKDFLLRWRDEGFELAYDNYVKLNQQHTAEMKETLKQLEGLSPVVGQATLADFSQAQYEADIAIMNADVLAYEQSFAVVVDLIQQRGFVDTGLEGEFRDAVHAIEDKVYEREGLDEMVITMLQMRRREKDYLLRGDQQYVDDVTDLTAQLKNQATASEILTPAEKVEIRTLADSYLTKFLSLVEKDRQVAEATEVFRAAAADIQTETEQLSALGEELAAQDIQTAQANSAQTFTLTVIVVLLALILSVVLALLLSGQITRPVRTLTDVANQLASGNYDAQAPATSGDEIGILAKAFNEMAGQIKKALATVAQRAAELQTVAEVSAATSTVLETDKLLWNVSNLTKERFGLYHAHIYVMNPAGDTLVLAAGAGDAGRQMVAEGRSIPLGREQSLVARSARDHRAVIVNDVQSAPDFLPHPLLPETRSELAVPMVIADEVLGVFDIQSDKVNYFTQENADIQTTLAAQIAIALQNARSYTDVQARAEREALITSIGQKIQSTSTVESALQVAIRELGRALSQDTRVVLTASEHGTQN